jgi:hypothetical protein
MASSPYSWEAFQIPGFFTKTFAIHFRIITFAIILKIQKIQ